MLFIDNQQAEIRESVGLQFVGANQDIDFTTEVCGLHPQCLRGFKSGDYFNGDGPIGEAIVEIIVMLLG